LRPMAAQAAKRPVYCSADSWPSCNGAPVVEPYGVVWGDGVPVS
jgi:hypothetical protein